VSVAVIGSSICSKSSSITWVKRGERVSVAERSSAGIVKVAIWEPRPPKIWFVSWAGRSSVPSSRVSVASVWSMTFAA